MLCNQQRKNLPFPIVSKFVVIRYVFVTNLLLIYACVSILICTFAPEI